MLRTAVRVGDDGRITSPAPLPASWPESFGFEALDTAADHAAIGFVPEPILVNPAIPGVFPYPISDSTERITDVGTVNVGAVLARLDSSSASVVVQIPAPAPRGVGLPGVGKGREAGTQLRLAVVLLSFGLAGGLLALTGKSRRRRS